MDRARKEELLLALRERAVRKARRSLLDFTRFTFPQFSPAAFHLRYYDVLTRFAEGEFKKLMIFMPPQHGKSEGSTRRLPAYLLGLDPDLRIAIVGYSSPMARRFNRDVQRVIDSPEFAATFPGTALAGMSEAESGRWVRNADEFEIVGHRGGLKTVGVGGPLTGSPVDVLIIDDIYKDAMSAWSSVVRSSIADWYDTVAASRLHNDSRQLIVFTRWHEEDLAGRLLALEGEFSPNNPNGWRVVIYPAIKEGGPTDEDPREEGEALWPELHSLEKLEAERERNPKSFASLYQQNPRPLEGLLYDRPFRDWEVIPATRRRVVKNYTDTADEGGDFLCSITYVETEEAIYILDVIYTQKPMETTEQMVAESITKHSVQVANIESNNGGRGFARSVERLCRTMGNTTTRVAWFHQSANKASRIFTRSAEVMNLVRFPSGWRSMWPAFANAISGYLSVGRNAHDDAPDALTGCVEQFTAEGRDTKLRNGNLW